MWKLTIAFAFAALAALSACRGGKPSNATTAQTAAPPSGAGAQAPQQNCNGQSPVWALQGAKVYLVPGDRLYGKTKHGAYLCLSDAQAQGYRPARRPYHHHHRHSKLFSV